MPRRAPAKRAIKQDRAVKTRQEIMNSAIRLFARRGVASTSMKQLGDAIGMTPGALYWHFKSKDDLLLEAISVLHQRFVQSFEPMLEEMAKWPAARQLEAFCTHTANYLGEHREEGIFYGMVGAEYTEKGEDVADALRDALHVYVTAIEQIIVFGQQKTKEFRTDVDARVMANAIIFSNIGVVVQQNLFQASVSYLPIVQQLHRVLLPGLLVG